MLTLMFLADTFLPKLNKCQESAYSILIINILNFLLNKLYSFTILYFLYDSPGRISYKCQQNKRVNGCTWYILGGASWNRCKVIQTVGGARGERRAQQGVLSNQRVYSTVGSNTRETHEITKSHELHKNQGVIYYFYFWRFTFNLSQGFCAIKS